MSPPTHTSEWRTRDGATWDNEDDAKAHEQLLDLEEAARNATQSYARALAKRSQTADGHPFEFGWRTYYYVKPGYFEMPSVERVSFTLPDCKVNERGEVVIEQRRTVANREVRYEYKVSELYSSAINAKRECAAQARKRLGELERDVEEMEACFRKDNKE